jgi:hypothetical protein
VGLANYIVADAAIAGVTIVQGGFAVSPLGATTVVYNPGTGAPTTGTYYAGQLCHDSNGNEFSCTTSGTPGSWVISQSATFAPVLPNAGSYVWNTDGTCASDADGNTYTYNADLSVHTITKGGITRTYTYNGDGTVAGVA